MLYERSQIIHSNPSFWNNMSIKLQQFQPTSE